ncbi:hypothetical protein [Salinicoccus albus]|uniref:hypothetical protein n=1 Tax=Salinicoccus albus TaxID=418756 RepID=UPI000361DB95|nr:hypothetical protein [Salinicoccus albus]
MHMVILISAFAIFVLFANIIDSPVIFSIAFVLFFGIAIVSGLFDYRKQKNKTGRYPLFKEFIVVLVLLVICVIPSLIYENPIPDLTSPIFLRSTAIAILMAVSASAVKYLSNKEDEGSG